MTFWILEHKQLWCLWGAARHKQTVNYLITAAHVDRSPSYDKCKDQCCPMARFEKLHFLMCANRCSWSPKRHVLLAGWQISKKQTTKHCPGVFQMILTLNEFHVYDVAKGSDEIRGNFKAVVLHHLLLGRLQFAVKGRSKKALHKKSFPIKGQRTARPVSRWMRHTINVQHRRVRTEAGNLKPHLHNNPPTPTTTPPPHQTLLYAVCTRSYTAESIRRWCTSVRACILSWGK